MKFNLSGNSGIGSKLLTLLVIVAIAMTGFGGAAAEITALEDQRIETTEETTSMWAEVSFNETNASADDTATVTVYNVSEDADGNETETEFATATITYDGTETTYLEEFDVSDANATEYRVVVEGDETLIESTSVGTFEKFVASGGSGSGSGSFGLGFLSDEIHGIPIGFALGGLVVIGGLYKYGEKQ